MTGVLLVLVITAKELLRDSNIWNGIIPAVTVVVAAISILLLGSAEAASEPITGHTIIRLVGCHSSSS